MAFVYDPDANFAHHVNGESVIHVRLASAHWEAALRGLIEEHVAETDSKWGAQLLLDWERARHHFWQVCPKEMLTRLQHPLDDTPQREAAE